MATTVLKLKNDYGPGASPNVITNAWLNFVADQLELVTTRLGDLAPAGCFRSTDFVLTGIPGRLAAELSAGAAVAGAPGERALLLLSEAVTIEGLPALVQTVYVWLSLDDDGDAGAVTVTVGDDPGEAPANGLLVATCATNATEVISGSENALPGGRVNLTDALSVLVDDEDQVGGKLHAKLQAGENITIIKTDGPNKQVQISAQGNPPGGDAGDVVITAIGPFAVAVDVPEGKSVIVRVDHGAEATFGLAEPPTITLDHPAFQAVLLSTSATGFDFRIERKPV